jgi:DNA-binding IclR family transcriptional regulator
MATTSPVPPLLGGPRRTQVLVLTALLGETYPTELARLLQAPVYSVQRIVDGLDKAGVFATRLSGRTRRVSLDPRFFAFKELRQLLLRLAEASPELQELAVRRRSRPRRAGKPM